MSWRALTNDRLAAAVHAARLIACDVNIDLTRATRPLERTSLAIWSLRRINLLARHGVFPARFLLKSTKSNLKSHYATSSHKLGDAHPSMTNP